MKYLNLGCGTEYKHGWTNVDFTSTGDDVIAHNLRKGIPFENNSFDVVYHSHVLEHFPKAEAPYFLQECLRVLKPNGILRVVIPDLEQIVKLYLKSLEKSLAGSQEWNHHYDWILLELYDQVVRTKSGGLMATYLAKDNLANEDFIIQRLGQEAERLIYYLRSSKTLVSQTVQAIDLSEREALLLDLLGSEDYQALQIGRFRQSGEVHQWMYDRYSLGVLLEVVGFQSYTVFQHNKSYIPNFASFCLDTLPDGCIRKPDSLFVEAVKPVISFRKKKVDTSAASRPDLSNSSVFLPDKPSKDIREIPYVQSLQCKIGALEEKVEKLQRRIHRFKIELKQSEAALSDITYSRFWKLRDKWLKLRGLLKK